MKNISNLFNIEIGKNIQSFLKKNDMEMDIFKLKIGLNYMKTHEILEAKDIDVMMLLKICKQLKFNFFHTLSEELNHSFNLFNRFSNFEMIANFENFSLYEKQFISFLITKNRNEEISIEDISDNFGIPRKIISKWLNVGAIEESQNYFKISISNIIKQIIYLRKMSLQDLSFELNKSVKEILMELDKDKFSCRELCLWSVALKIDLFSIISVYLNTSYYIRNVLVLDASCIINHSKNVYSDEFKNEIIKLVTTKKMPRSKISQNYNIPYNTISRWIKQKSIISHHL